MLNLSLSSTTPSPPSSYSFPRVSLSLSSSSSSSSSSLSFSLSSSSSSSLSFSLTSSSSSPSPVRLFASRRTSSSSYSCECYSFKVRGMAELVQDAEKTSAAAASSSSGNDENQNSSNESSSNEIKHSRTFVNVRSEEELLSAIRKEVEAGKLPPNIATGMEELYHNYKNAVLESKIPNSEEVVLSNMRVALDRVLLDVEDPFVFSPYHKALREPFDYYMFGQNYIRPLIDFDNSYVGNVFIFDEIIQKAHQGHNIVLMSNHQSEADPAVIALLLESTHVHIAENMAYVAGDRVIMDPLSKPFSMGRNLICVYSKKHMFDVPELSEMKRRANTRSLKEMALLLRGGSQIIWIAPSGGRDRPDPVTEEWHPAPFDSSSVDNMRRLVEHSGVPGHIYPLALQCYEIMPPPPKVEKEIGEKRVIAFRGAGLSIATPINFNEVTATCNNPEEAKEAYSQALFKSVNEQYEVLKSAIQGKKGLEASTTFVSLSQPWK